MRLSVSRMRLISSEPLMNGLMARIITKSGLWYAHEAINCSVDVQHTTFTESQPTISAMSVATLLREEYITIFDLLISVGLPLPANEKCAKC